MPDAVNLSFVIPDEVSHGATMYVYGDNATGSIDYDNPIAGPLRISRAPKNEQFLNSPFLSGPFFGIVEGDGFLCGHFLEHDWLGRERTARWAGGLFYGPRGPSGNFQFAAKIRDFVGLVSSDTPATISVPINTFPRQPPSIVPVSLIGDVVTFTIGESEDF